MRLEGHQHEIYVLWRLQLTKSLRLGVNCLSERNQSLLVSLFQGFSTSINDPSLTPPLLGPCCMSSKLLPLRAAFAKGDPHFKDLAWTL
jgi:hypothetical protein